MILSLHIENIAIVKKLDIDMKAGFVVLTGETGAGKSIIIDSLNLLGGARADKELIRNGEERAEVSALFSVNDAAQQVLSEMGISVDDGTVLLSRTLSTSAASQVRINGRLVNMSMLREVAAALFNIHGQNDNVKLLDKKNHLKILDSFAGCDQDVAEYLPYYREIVKLRADIEAFDRDVMENNRLCEMLKYQVEDINSLKLKDGEEEVLVARSKTLQSIEKIEKSLSLVDRALSGGERSTGAIYMIDKAGAALSQLSDAMPEAASLAARLDDIKYELEDISESAAALKCDVEGDPSLEIDKIESRLDAISKLKRKYGQSIKEILAYRDDAQKRLDAIENSDEEKAKLFDKLEGVTKKARALAEKIREKRKKAAIVLRKSVTESLVFLDMPRMRFEVGLSAADDFLSSGLDECEFMVATNVGEPLMPMAKIASGGELARIMLSLKSVLNECDGIGTAIFDEIDTGISGKTSRKVGIKLREISAGTQVVCVTHSAQIASLASSHLFISKSEKDGRVETSVCELDDAGRVEEIARILGGIEISDLVRSTAKEMIDEGSLI